MIESEAAPFDAVPSQKGERMNEQIAQAETQLASLTEFLLSSRPKMTGAEINVLKVHLDAVKARLQDVKEHHAEA